MNKRLWSLSLACNVIAWTGCAPEQPVVTPEATPAEVAVPKLAEPETAAPDTTVLVPSPIETQAALAATGVDVNLADLIDPRSPSETARDADRVAIRTGVVLADMILTVKTSEKDTLLAQVQAIQADMAELKGGSDIDATLKGMNEAITADAVTRDELLKEFDELSSAVIPELTFNGRERIVPLIQAGGWLEGIHLVARAIKATGNLDAANNLLKAPSVAEHFLSYVKSAPEGVDAQAQKTTVASLSALHAIASKEAPLTEDDVDTIIAATGAVLSLL